MPALCTAERTALLLTRELRAQALALLLASISAVSDAGVRGPAPGERRGVLSTGRKAARPGHCLQQSQRAQATNAHAPRYVQKWSCIVVRADDDILRTILSRVEEGALQS